MYLRRRCNSSCNIGEQTRRKGIIEVSTMQWYQPAGDERRGGECRGKKCRELVWLRWQEGRRHVLTQLQYHLATNPMYLEDRPSALGTLYVGHPGKCCRCCPNHSCQLGCNQLLQLAPGTRGRPQGRRGAARPKKTGDCVEANRAQKDMNSRKGYQTRGGGRLGLVRAHVAAAKKPRVFNTTLRP